MLIAFAGDLHGRVLHLLAVLTEWQLRTNQKLDAIIQVGDLGAYPEPSEELKKEKYVMADPAELDFSRYLQAEGLLAANIRRIREHELSRIHFIRGNHEDFNWLNEQGLRARQGVVSVDPYDLYHYVMDGTILKWGELKLAFLGGIQTAALQPKSIDPEAYDKLMLLPPGEIDILITHDAPFGIGLNYYGQPQGSTLLSALIERTQPKFHIAGHYHHINGPRAFGSTTYLGLNVLVDVRDDHVQRRIQPGSIAILDTATDYLQVITENWFSQMDKDFDFNTYMEHLIIRNN